MSDAKTIFISYSGDDATWKDAFTADRVFKRKLGPDVKLLDYTDSGNIGRIKEWILDGIDTAKVILLFLSASYIKSDYSTFEFFTGLDRAAKTKLVFVPIMMDAEAIAWWRAHKAEGDFVDLVGDTDEYAYVDFTDGGKPADLITPHGYVTRYAKLIGDLAERIKEKLEQRTLPKPSPVPKMVLLLGHPTAVMPEELRTQCEELDSGLRNFDLPIESWPDRWLAKPDIIRPQMPALLKRDPIFVQPLGLGEFSSLQNHRDRLKRVAGEQFAASVDERQFLLWLPDVLGDDLEFEKAKGGLPKDHVRLNGTELAKELKSRLRSEHRPSVSVIMLEDMTNTSLWTRLRDTFCALVESEVQPRPDEFLFSGNSGSDMLERQIDQVSGDKVILAIHDLNVGPVHKPADFRLHLDNKLGSYEKRVRQAQRNTNRNELSVFWSTLVVRNARYCPFVQHPSPQFRDWRLLPMTNEETAPQSEYTIMFKAFLRQWAAA